ncbi:MAG: hypothetical protein R3B82_12075 [Sandaracinaceae bacterium]
MVLLDRRDHLPDGQRRVTAHVDPRARRELAQLVAAGKDRRLLRARGQREREAEDRDARRAHQ